MTSTYRLALALVATFVVAPLTAQPGDFQWRGTLAEGQTVEIRGVNGSVRALASTDGAVRVEASRTARRSDVASVRIEVVEHADGVTICAVYPTPSGTRRPNECRPGGGQMSIRDNDVRVDFVVRVPAGVRFEGHALNGGIRAEGLRSDVRATTTNGSVSIETTGFARATTVNGDVECRIGQNQLPSDVRFETVNGNVTVAMPAGLNAEFRASTVNGRIDSDFPIVVSGQVSRRSLRGTIGAGGPELRVTTVNGNIRLREI